MERPIPLSSSSPRKRATGANPSADVSRSWSRLGYFGVLLAALIIWGPRAEAAITSFDLTGGQAFPSGDVVQLSDPIGTISANGFNDDNVYVFDEAQGVTLTENVLLDVFSPTLQTSILGVGSVVSSHYVIFDPASGKDAEGFVTFDEPILGVIRESGQFSATNTSLGNATANYTIGNPSLESGDVASFSGNTLTFDIQANSPGDAVRVITGTSVVPGVTLCDPGTETVTGTVTGGQALGDGGTVLQICNPIGPVGDDNFQSPQVFVFEEQQGVLLDSAFLLDSLNFIEAGETISSYYVVFDPGASTTVQATLTFPDDIVGVIRDRDELTASIPIVGNASATYLSPGLLGLESGDTTSISGNVLTINFAANSPGDSVRVILGSASPSLTFSPCPPNLVTVTGSVTGGTAAAAGGVLTENCPPIGPVGNDNFQSSDLFTFVEQTKAVLTNTLTADEGPTTTFAAGTRVSSYYVAFDPPSSQSITGSIVFPRPILGVMTSSELLEESDELQNPSGIYLNPGLRGLEANEDSISISGNTLTVSFLAASPGDYIRVILPPEAPTVPSMGRTGWTIMVLLCLGFGIAWVGAFRTRAI